MSTLTEQAPMPLAETAAKVRVSRRTVVRWIREGVNHVVLRSFRVGGRRIIYLNDLNDFLDSITIEGFPDQPKPIRTPARRTISALHVMIYM
ncbi:MAG: helix-turn-helix domain-containing protein [Planctomycetaceae bacterium]|jgi:excisionase family DNA binding protein|nr:helix-turn-helix domain-containing protein [Planctomycetaceae bacterium]